MKKNSTIFLIAIIYLFSIAQAKSQTQGKLTLECKFKVDQGNFVGFVATLIRDSTVIESFSGESSYGFFPNMASHDFLLDYNHKYLLKLTKEGYLLVWTEPVSSILPIGMGLVGNFYYFQRGKLIA